MRSKKGMSFGNLGLTTRVIPMMKLVAVRLIMRKRNHLMERAISITEKKKERKNGKRKRVGALRKKWTMVNDGKERNIKNGQYYQRLRAAWAVGFSFFKGHCCDSAAEPLVPGQWEHRIQREQFFVFCFCLFSIVSR